MNTDKGLFLVVFTGKGGRSKEQCIERFNRWSDRQSFYGCRIRFIEPSGRAQGRGALLKRLWQEANDEMLAYADSNSIIDFGAIEDICTALSEGYDLVAGSRCIPGRKGRRPFLRRWLSSGYNRLIRKVFKIRCSDAQCHLKALRREAARRLIPEIESDKSFFDTELLVSAAMNGLRIKELPITFVEPAQEKISDLFGYFIEDMAHIISLKRRLATLNRKIRKNTDDKPQR